MIKNFLKIIIGGFILISINFFAINLAYTPSPVPTFNQSQSNLIVFFGTTPKINGFTNAYFQNRAQKVLELVDLFPNSKVLLSGDHQEFYSELEPMKQQLLDSGVPSQNILLHYAKDTFDTMRYLKKIYQNHSYQNIFTVSQKFHLQRAQYLARMLDFQTVCIEASDVTYNRSKILIREYFARTKVYIDLLRYFLA